jgi:hypothetical protein
MRARSEHGTDSLQLLLKILGLALCFRQGLPDLFFAAVDKQ